MSFYKGVRVVVLTLGVAGAMALTGCGVGSEVSAVDPGPSTAALGTIQGSNFGGHAPIVGAHIFVLEATTNGYGAVTKSLLSATFNGTTYPTLLDVSGGATNGLYYVQTDLTGSFNITGDYTCDIGSPVYLYAAGGNATTVVGAPANPAIVNMAMLGVCATGNFSSLNFVFINEVSTVAMAYSMAGFAKDSLHIGSSSTNATGLKNAALNAATLYSIQGGPYTGTVNDGEGHIANVVNPNNNNGTVPQATIDSLANIVANCVDSNNIVAGTSAAVLALENVGCRALFLSTTSNGVTGTSAGGATVPIDTGTAMINLAHFPAGVNLYPGSGPMDSTNPKTLYGLPTGVVPFTPQLTTQPKDWTIVLTYKNIPSPSAIAIDGAGDAYVGTGSATAGYITELSSQGAVSATSTTSVPNLTSLAVSTASAVWAASSSANNLYKFTSALGLTGTVPSSVTPDPTALAIDLAGNVYVVGNSGQYPFYISEFTSAGVLSHYYYNYEFAASNGIALASDGTVWLSNTNAYFGLYMNPSAEPNAGTTTVNPISSGRYASVDAIAVDYQGEVWMTANASYAPLDRSTTADTLTAYGVNVNSAAIGGLNDPIGVAVDGGSIAYNGGYFNVWTANYGNNTLSEVNSSTPGVALSPSVGYESGTMLVNGPSAIAVDNSGDVWVTNRGNSTVLEMIGSANPVTTPFAMQTPGVLP